MAQQIRDSERLGDPRVARQWLLDYGGKLVEPNEQDLADLDRVMEHDEFWEWSSGKVDFPVMGNTTWWQTVQSLAILGLVFGGLLLVLAIVQWFVHG